MNNIWITVALLPFFATRAIQPWYWSAHFQQRFAEDWSNTTFDSYLRNSTAEYVLVEFYAPWCSHCQLFKPEFERLSQAIRHLNEDVGGKMEARTATSITILPAALDCVRNAKMCDFFGVDSYPTLLWGSRTDWLETTCFHEPSNRLRFQCANTVNKLNEIKAQTFNSALTADNVAGWISNRTSAALVNLLSNAGTERDAYRHLFEGSTETMVQDARTISMEDTADLWDAQLAVAMWLRQIFDKHRFTRPSSSDAASKSDRGGRDTSLDVPFEVLTDFVDVLTRRFPDVEKSSPCRESLVGLQETLRNELGEVVESESFGRFRIDADSLEKKWTLCGTDWKIYGSGWHSCRSTLPGKRGFTCGLWNLLHMLAAQATDEAALADLQKIRQAILRFFDCQACRDHFARFQAPNATNMSRREAQLWWWQAHNAVNSRVKQIEEQAQSGDPGFPKMQWPSKAHCPACRSQVVPEQAFILQNSKGYPSLRGAAVSAAEEAREHWNLDEVANFLDRFYGGLTRWSVPT